MASDLEYVRHVCDQARGAGEVTYRMMFGEYAIYLGGKVVALVCDNQLFVKPTEGGRALLERPAEGPPYPGAKPHLILDEYLDDSGLISEVFRVTEAALPAPTPRRPRGKTKATTRAEAGEETKAEAGAKAKAKAGAKAGGAKAKAKAKAGGDRELPAGPEAGRSRRRRAPGEGGANGDPA
jgi:TfoX/Sxy family transcriptional regulator of competence genes